MNNPRRLTPFGIEVKKKLLELRLTQNEFCEQHGLSAKRMSEILYGVRPGVKLRQRIAAILHIEGEQAEAKGEKDDK